jgi:hypothetical protein
MSSSQYEEKQAQSCSDLLLEESKTEVESFETESGFEQIVSTSQRQPNAQSMMIHT